jgi:hypothetical protein
VCRGLKEGECPGARRTGDSTPWRRGSAIQNFPGEVVSDYRSIEGAGELISEVEDHRHLGTTTLVGALGEHDKALTVAGDIVDRG